MMGLGMGFGLVGLILMALFWIGLVAGAVFLVRALFPTVNQQTPDERRSGANARQILDERYARGEMDRSEYEAMKEDLST